MVSQTIVLMVLLFESLQSEVTVVLLQVSLANVLKLLLMVSQQAVASVLLVQMLLQRSEILVSLVWFSYSNLCTISAIISGIP